MKSTMTSTPSFDVNSPEAFTYPVMHTKAQKRGILPPVGEYLKMSRPVEKIGFGIHLWVIRLFLIYFR